MRSGIAPHFFMERINKDASAAFNATVAEQPTFSAKHKIKN